MKILLKIFFVFMLLQFAKQASSYTVSNLKATYSGGQVFLTWTTPAATNLKYNVYRSTNKFTLTSQLNSSTLIGNVRDSSCKNFRLSEQLGGQRFFKTDNIGTTVSASKGLYVFTCLDNQSYFYCVTVTKLSNNTEAKKIKDGKNNLKTAVAESVSTPQPILQDSAVWSTGDVVHYYVWFGNNIEAPGFPAMCSQGSYGFNFYLIKRGSATSFPVFAFYEGLLENSLKGNGIDSFKNVTGCYILGFDDWLPTPTGNSVGENTFWSGYHESYDFYKSDNSIPTTGVVKMYSQRRYIQSILWARKFSDADSNKVYVIGISAGAMGAYLTSNIIPNKITAAYCVVGDFKLITIDNNDTQPEQMWGTAATNLNSDILNPESGEPLKTFDLFDTRFMFSINKNQNMPLIFCVYGKNDLTIPWTSFTVSLSDSIENNQLGGIFYWDQRVHDGTGKNFNDGETMPDWYSFANNLSYPAFSNCTINQDIGDGTQNNGAAYGAINGYLSWTKDNVTDNTCNITYRTKLATLYVGGVADPQQYSTCFADVTVRRAQNFNPSLGSTIKWNNFDSTDSKIQNGSFVYNGGLITIAGVQINKSGCRLDIKISNCLREESEESDVSIAPQIDLQQAQLGYNVSFENLPDEDILLSVVNILGEPVLNKIISPDSGAFQIRLPKLTQGIYIIALRNGTFSLSKKVYISY